MIVLKKIGPVIIGRQAHRFNLNQELSEVVIEHLKKTNQLEALQKAGIIGVKKDESLRPEQSGQSKDTDQRGRPDSGNDGNKSGDGKPSNKRKAD